MQSTVVYLEKYYDEKYMNSAFKFKNVRNYRAFLNTRNLLHN